MSPDSELALVGGLFRALSVFRFATLAYAALGVALSREFLIREPLAWIFIAIMGATSLLLTAGPTERTKFNRMSPAAVFFELSIGVVVLLGDGLVYSSERVQSLPWSWPAAGIMAAGILYGTQAGFFTSLFIGCLLYTSDAADE